MNEEKLAALHGAVNSGDNSHIVAVPPGPMLSDALIGSPIFQVGVPSGVLALHGGHAAGSGGGRGPMRSDRAPPSSRWVGFCVWRET